MTAAGARSRHEIKGPSAVQDEGSRGELVSVRAGLGPARGRDAVARCRRRRTRGARRRPVDQARRRRSRTVRIETALTLRLVFRVPLRQAEGFLRSVLSLMGVDLAAPDHTTLSRRSQSLAVAMPPHPIARTQPSHRRQHGTVDCGRRRMGCGATRWTAATEAGRRGILLVIEWA